MMLGLFEALIESAHGLDVLFPNGEEQFDVFGIAHLPYAALRQSHLAFRRLNQEPRSRSAVPTVLLLRLQSTVLWHCVLCAHRPAHGHKGQGQTGLPKVASARLVASVSAPLSASSWACPGVSALLARARAFPHDGDIAGPDNHAHLRRIGCGVILAACTGPDAGGGEVLRSHASWPKMRLASAITCQPST